MTTATARKTSLENKHLPNSGNLRLSHVVRNGNVGKSRYNWIGERAFKLNTENFKIYGCMLKLSSKR